MAAAEAAPASPAELHCASRLHKAGGRGHPTQGLFDLSFFIALSFTPLGALGLLEAASQQLYLEIATKSVVLGRFELCQRIKGCRGYLGFMCTYFVA